MIQANKQICVIGLGYIGLPTAALLANRGHNVHGVDVDGSVYGYGYYSEESK